MVELIRPYEQMQGFRVVSTKDGIIDLFGLPRAHLNLRCEQPDLCEALILPINIKSFRTTRELFDEIVALLRNHVMLPTKECSLLAYWAIATWFTDYLPFLPSVVVSGPASTADLLLRTLAAVCRRPLLLGELSPAILRKLPINEISPTLLIREPQLNRYMSSLLNASNQPGYLFFSANMFQRLYCPKCIYVGECFKDSPATSNSCTHKSWWECADTTSCLADKGRDNLFSKSTSCLSLIESRQGGYSEFSRCWIPARD